MNRLCEIACLNRSSCYKWLKRDKSKSELENELITEWIKELYEEQNGILGYRQMTITINREKNVQVQNVYPQTDEDITFAIGMSQKEV